jgi:citrate lyase beta subunit
VEKLRYFDYIGNEDLERIFLQQPQYFNNDTELNLLKYSLGAFLYIPATQYNMIYKTIRGEVMGVRPLAICLEDSVGVKGEKEAIKNLKLALEDIKNKNIENIPLIFIRIKDINQLEKISDIIISNKKIITGILLPKADAQLIEKCINILNSFKLLDIYVIPIIESKEFIYKESKEYYFKNVYKTLLKHKDRILNIRIGIADVLGIYGIRRSKSFSIYDNIICTSFIHDVINYLNRPELDIPISGGVSELFDMDDELIKNKYIEEILLDKFHGLIGKTVIHPSQVKLVQALQVVSYEDYMDANTILNSIDSIYGVSKGILGGRMNEVNPHLLWAKKTMILSQIYGVLNEGVDYNELFRF